jgi:hypothetical protein
MNPVNGTIKRRHPMMKAIRLSLVMSFPFKKTTQKTSA